jgi:hypothetical protein
MLKLASPVSANAEVRCIPAYSSAYSSVSALTCAFASGYAEGNFFAGIL